MNEQIRSIHVGRMKCHLIFWHVAICDRWKLKRPKFTFHFFYLFVFTSTPPFGQQTDSFNPKHTLLTKPFYPNYCSNLCTYHAWSRPCNIQVHALVSLSLSRALAENLSQLRLALISCAKDLHHNHHHYHHLQRFWSFLFSVGKEICSLSFFWSLSPFAWALGPHTSP